MGDQDSRAPLQQALGGTDNSRLRDRIHACCRLVEDDHLHVADQQPGEGNELLLPGGEAGAARAEQRVQPVRESVHPVVQAKPFHGVGHLRSWYVAEECDVLRQRRREHLGALGHDTDGPAELLQVEIAHVLAAEEDRSSRRLDRPGQQRRQRRLARSGAPDERDRRPGLDVQIDVAQGERAFGVREVKASDGDPEVT